MRRPPNAYEQALFGLSETLKEMGKYAEQIIVHALEALMQNDAALIECVLSDDDKIDALDEELNYRLLRLITLQKPTESELRYLFSVQRVSRDLERVGDYGVNIGKAASVLLEKGPLFKPLEDIPLMAEEVKEMVGISVAAFTERDLKKAEEAIKKDDKVDELFLFLHDELIGYMKKGAEYIEQGTYLLLIARYLERAGDHAVNIAKSTFFCCTGKLSY